MIESEMQQAVELARRIERTQFGDDGHTTLARALLASAAEVERLRAVVDGFVDVVSAAERYRAALELEVDVPGDGVHELNDLYAAIDRIRAAKKEQP